jgi:hypothetical protein
VGVHRIRSASFPTEVKDVVTCFGQEPGLFCKLPLHLFANGTPTSQDASARDEAMAPILRRKYLSQSAQTPTMILAYEGL